MIRSTRSIADICTSAMVTSLTVVRWATLCVAAAVIVTFKYIEIYQD